MRKYGFSVIDIPPYKDKIYDFIQNQYSRIFYAVERIIWLPNHQQIFAVCAKNEI